MKDFIIKNKNIVISLACWIIVWALVSHTISNKILLPSPIEVLNTLYELIFKKSYWTSIINSMLQVILGLLLGVNLGIILAILSYKINVIKIFLSVPFSVIKSMPIASIVVTLLIWMKSKYLPIFVASFVVLPNIYFNMLEGLFSVDYKLLQMAEVFNVKKYKKIKYIYLESLKPFLIPSIVISTGISWKSAISAEVMGLSVNTIGEQIYYSKLYLDTKELFAWSITIVILSKLFESIFIKLLLKVGKYEYKDN